MGQYKLALYYFDSCPFCVRVLKKIDELNIQGIEYKNILEDSSNREKLINDTGRSTVPCLYINDQPMFESQDIMAWLEEHKGELK